MLSDLILPIAAAIILAAICGYAIRRIDAAETERGYISRRVNIGALVFCLVLLAFLNGFDAEALGKG